MATKYYLAFLLFYCGIIFSCSNCGLFECVGGPTHSFEKKVAISPEKIQYHIGDTIWIGTEFSCQGLTNLSTGEIEDFCGVKNLSAAIQILLLEPWPQDTQFPTPAAKQFDFQNASGSVSIIDDKNINALFLTEGDEYRLHIGMIPQRSGQYALFLHGGGPYSLNGTDKCGDTGYFGLTIEGQDKHMELLEAFKHGAQNVTEYERAQGYCFEVVQ